MEIKRQKLVSELVAFALADHGMVVGKPGIGKSYLLNRLRKELKTKEVLTFIVRIDNLSDGSDASVGGEMGLESNWIETLNQVKLPNAYKAILLFDAFDAARDERLRKEIIGQIRKAKNVLSEKWNILVSVRTYDATKSAELRRLFSLPGSSGELQACRKLDIHELEEDEIIAGLEHNNQMLLFYQSSSPELKEVLRVPFFLVLLENILMNASPEQEEEIRKFKSEIQLLERYWRIKIVDIDDSISKERFLSALTNLLVSERSLNTSKAKLHEAISFEDSVFNYLRSENIIDEISVNGNRLAYSHNILFDYAISVFCLTDNYAEIIAFINADKSRPFFLRPSFVYFFTALWYQQRDRFWEFYWKLLKEEIKEVQLFIKLVLNGVITSEFHSPDDLTPVLSFHDNVTRNTVIRNILQSIRFIRNYSQDRDVALLSKLSETLNEVFLFEFGFLLDRATESAKVGRLLQSGPAARAFLGYVLDNRTSPNKPILDRMGASRGIELVSRTYGSDPVESKALLTRVLDLLKEPSFDIWYFSNLAEHIKYILPEDPSFVAHVYQEIFAHRETADERTSMGSSVIMNFTSTRRQDFDMCYFRLQEFFPTFMASAPDIALPLGLELVNTYVMVDRGRFLHMENVQQFNYGSIECQFLLDYSSMWADSIHYHKQADLVNDILEYIGSLLKDSNLAYKKYLIEYIKHAKVGYTWRQFFKLAGDYPEQLWELTYPLLLEPILMQSPDTSYEVRNCINRFVPYLSNDQIKTIEETIFKVYSDEKKFVIAQALSMIPPDKLQLKASIDFIRENGTRENEPPFQHTTSVETFTTEMWLEEQGVDLNDPVNKELQLVSHELQQFNEQWMNAKPPDELYGPTFEKARQAYDALIEKKEQVNPELYFSVFREITKTFAILCGNLEKFSEAEIKVLKDAAIAAFNTVSPYDRGSGEDSSPSHGWSPTPRIEAAESFLFFYLNKQSEENWTLLQSALNDDNGVVRFQAAKRIIEIADVAYDKYWETMLFRLDRETDTFLYTSLVGNLKFQPPIIVKQCREIVSIIEKKDFLFGSHNDFHEQYAELLLWFMYKHKIPEATELLRKSYSRPEFCRTIIFKIFERLHPSFPNNDYVNDPHLHQDVIAMVRYYVGEAGAVLKNVPPDQLNTDQPNTKHAFSVLDEVILRIYFQLSAKNIRNTSHTIPVNPENRSAFYFMVKPIYQEIIEISSSIAKRGIIIGHTAHYFTQSLNMMLSSDPKDILSMAAKVTRLSVDGGYTFDSYSIQEMTKLTEKLLADHRDLLMEDEPFNDLIDMLDIYMKSGWVDALQLLWKLDEVFR